MNLAAAVAVADLVGLQIFNPLEGRLPVPRRQGRLFIHPHRGVVEALNTAHWYLIGIYTTPAAVAAEPHRALTAAATHLQT
jgi:hypothetical protein